MPNVSFFKGCKTVVTTSMSSFFLFKVDSQAPRRAVQCLLAYKLIHLVAGVQSQLDGPPKVGNTSTPTSPGNRTPPTSAKPNTLNDEKNYINTNRLLAHHKLGRSTIRKVRQINSSRCREDRRCKKKGWLPRRLYRARASSKVREILHRTMKVS